MASVRRIMTLLDTKEVLPDGDIVLDNATVKGHYQVQNVDFKYRTGDTVLNQLNLEILPGQTVGIVGSTGAGKSSMIKLLMRMYDVTNGRILLDGEDIRNYTLESLAQDRKSTRLNSSHVAISYAVFCLKKKKSK